MVRWLAIGALCVAIAGCNGEIDNSSFEGLSPEQRVARQRWFDKAEPVFKLNCASCHNGSMIDPPGYLAGATDLDIRATIVGFTPPVVNLAAPATSRVLVKGSHTGPAMTAQQYSDVLSWIMAERDATESGPAIESAPITAMQCTSGAPGDATCPINSLDLVALGVAGTFEFVAMPVSGGAAFDGMQFKAGAEGIYLAHPQFISHPATSTTPVPDATDRFFNAVLNIAPNATTKLGTGAANFNEFDLTAPMSIHFDLFEKYHPGT